MSTDPRDEKRRQEALRDLERVNESAEVIGTSAFRRAAKHFSAEDATKDDWAELWGKRIGRGLSLLIVLFLIYHLVTTYVLR
ncbi:hypothetical protein ACKTEK_14165 [Tepidamorphus sp. 3E244]|uniref:hypothetical protein n=1 Tax=Tepidamorphus sp. 3E244 TaxID=3385498 RepID=UPI0038FCB183